MSSLLSPYISNGFYTDKRSEDRGKQSAEGVWFKGHSPLSLTWLWLLFKENCQRKKQTKATAKGKQGTEGKVITGSWMFSVVFLGIPFIAIRPNKSIYLFNNNKNKWEEEKKKQMNSGLWTVLKSFILFARRWKKGTTGSFSLRVFSSWGKTVSPCPHVQQICRVPCTWHECFSGYWNIQGCNVPTVPYMSGVCRSFPSCLPEKVED